MGDPRRQEHLLLVLLVVLAAALRLVRLGESPPGIHVDAAANAWNAYCLLKTGHDWLGAAWPVIYSRGFGENQSTLYYYALLPFQAVFGMSAWSTILPSALSGVASVGLAYEVGARMFDRAVGLAFAALLALSPWHLFVSRWGHEAGLVPLLVLLPISALLCARLPIGDGPVDEARPFTAAAAGLAFGIACYGYYALRVFFPLFLVTTVVANWRDWWSAATKPNGRRAFAGLLLGICVTLGPLAWAQLTDPEVSKRGREFLLWEEADPVSVRIERVAERYARHFDPRFLFIEGDRWVLHTLPRGGPLPWVALPLLVVGAVAILREARSSRSARTLLLWVLLYPASDSFTWHESVHMLRSSPGLVGLSLLAAVGLVRGGNSLRSRRPAVRRLAGLLVLGAVFLESGSFLWKLFGEWGRSRTVRHAFNADLLEVSGWLRSRLDHVDAVFISTQGSAALDQPFAVTLVGLDYDPEQWFSDVRRIRSRGDTDVVTCYGKIHFVFEPTDLADLNALRDNGRPDRVLFIVRPGEIRDGDPIHVVLWPDGTPAFLVYERVL
jgi:4-amino-4-deoxy-L-arabinose transferase-like glycosyltransferase